MFTYLKCLYQWTTSAAYQLPEPAEISKALNFTAGTLDQHPDERMKYYRRNKVGCRHIRFRRNAPSKVPEARLGRENVAGGFHSTFRRRAELNKVLTAPPLLRAT